MLNTNGATLPVSIPLNMGNGGTFGGNFGSDIIALAILGLIFGNGNGNGIFGGRGGNTSVYEGYVLNNDMSILNKAITDQGMVMDRKFEGIANGICSLGYDQLAQMNGINTNIMTVGNTIQAAVKDCCCTTQQNIKDTQYVISDKANMLDRGIADGFCQTNFNAQNNARDIIASQTSGTQAILSRLDAMETSRLREKLEAERDARYALQGQLDRAQLRTDIVNDVRPCPKPAYITCNPFGCNCNNGYAYGYTNGTTIA